MKCSELETLAESFIKIIKTTQTTAKTPSLSLSFGWAASWICKNLVREKQIKIQCIAQLHRWCTSNFCNCYVYCYQSRTEQRWQHCTNKLVRKLLRKMFPGKERSTF